MAVAYNELLDATIHHLEELKSRGVRNVAVSKETLRALAQAAPKFQISNFKPEIEKTSAAPASKTQTTISMPAKKIAATPPSTAPTSEIQNLKSQIISSSPEKAAAFAELRKRALSCVKCPHLASSRKNVVFGVGSIDAQLMFVGEAPGADEDEQGEPFVGRAGQLLTKIIQATGLSRADVYIANILKCRPDTPGQSAGNRKPTPDEMATCIPYLHEQIDLIRPESSRRARRDGGGRFAWQDRRHHEAARQLADVSRHAAHADVSSGVSAAQPGDEREAQSLGRHAGRDGKTRNAHQREAAEFLFEGVKINRPRLKPNSNHAGRTAENPPR